MATRHVLAELCDAAAAAGLPPVAIDSVGGVAAAQRVARGEHVDLVFLALEAITALAAAGRVDPATVVPLMLSQVAVAVRSGADQPAERTESAAFADAAGVRKALLAADRIGYSTGPSGAAIVGLIEQWGLAARLEGRLVQARPGTPVAALLSAGEVDLGFQQLSELVGQVGVRVLGVMPADCAIDTVFAGAVSTASSDPVRAAEVLSFLASAEVARIKIRHSFGII